MSRLLRGLLSLIKHLIKFYNHDLIPVVYEQGSLGASGDLAPLAHMCLPLLGKVYTDTGAKESTKILKKKNIKNFRLSYKEGLALLNGTQFMLSFFFGQFYNLLS